MSKTIAPADTLTEQELAERNAAQPNPEAAFTDGAPTANEILAAKSEAVPFSAEQMTADTMLGDMVRLVLDEIRAAPDVWAKLPEHKQDDVIRRVTTQCTRLVSMAVQLIAADGRVVISADLEQITAKDEIKAVLKMQKHDPNRHLLLDAVGLPVLIVVAGSSQFLGGEIPRPEPNQRELPVPEPEPDAGPVADNGRATAVQA